MPQVSRPSRIIQLKIELLEVVPHVWRRVQVPAWISLAELHEIIQDVMGWEDRHLYRFLIDGTLYSSDKELLREDRELMDAKKAELAQAVSKEAMFYEYDLGDGWRHKLSFEKMLEPDTLTRYPICIGGENACPPEDCGGPHGYSELLSRLSNPKDPEHDSAREWVGGYFDPKGFDPNLINRALLWTEDL